MSRYSAARVTRVAGSLLVLGTILGGSCGTETGGVSLGIFSIVARVNSEGGDFPASYSVVLKGPYERDPVERDDCLAEDDNRLPGFGTLRNNITVPTGSTAPFELSTQFHDLGVGCYSVSVDAEDLPPNCLERSDHVPIYAGIGGSESKSASLSVTCHLNRIAVSVESMGDRADIPNSYTISVDGGPPVALTVPASPAPYTVVETVRHLATGSHTVDLTVPDGWDNCTVSLDPPSITEDVVQDETTNVEFTVDCGTFQGPQTFVFGTMFGGDGTTPLPGITVGISGIPSVLTDAQGEYRIDVTPGGNLSLFASGVCDPDPIHSCNFERSFNSTEAETLTAPEGQETEFNPQAQRGYHLKITSGFSERTVAAGSTFQVQLGYEVWNRANLPGATPRITLGIDGTAGPSPPFLQPGAYPPGATGTTDMTLTAPSTPGDYYVYALLVTATATTSATEEYERLFPNGRLFIRVFKLTVE